MQGCDGARSGSACLGGMGRSTRTLEEGWGIRCVITGRCSYFSCFLTGDLLIVASGISMRLRGTNIALPRFNVIWVRLDLSAVRAVAGPAPVCFGLEERVASGIEL